MGMPTGNDSTHYPKGVVGLEKDPAGVAAPPKFKERPHFCGNLAGTVSYF